MHAEQITAFDHPLFPALWEIYEHSFPPAEKRTRAGQEKAMAYPHYHLDAWLEEDNSLVGLMGWWDFDIARYVDHYAISPLARSGGYGSRILSQWMRSDDKPVILEIDPVVDEISTRRLAFYSRLGYVENPMDHVQPAYQPGTEDVPLRVLSWPAPLSQGQYDSFRRALESSVWQAR